MIYTLLSIGGMALMMVVGLFLAIYIVSALGLFTLAKINGYEDLAFLAFIPVANNYLLAIMGGDADIFGAIKVRDKYMGIILIFLSIVTGVAKKGNIAIMLVYLVFSYYAYFNLYKKIDYENSRLFSVLSVLIPFFAPIYLYIKRYTLFSDDYNIIE